MLAGTDPGVGGTAMHFTAAVGALVETEDVCLMLDELLAGTDPGVGVEVWTSDGVREMPDDEVGSSGIR